MTHPQIVYRIPWLMVEPHITMCVLNRLRTGQYDQIMRWWSSKPHSGIATVLDSVAYGYVLLPWLPCYSIPHLSYPTRSFSHLGVACLKISISIYHTRSSVHPDVSLICPRILNFRSASLYSPGSYCVALTPHCFLLFVSQDISVKFDLSCFSVASCHHCASPSCPYPLYPFSLVHTSNVGRNATHCATVACSIPLQVITNYIPAASWTSSALGVTHVISAIRCDCFPIICLRKPVCAPSILLSISAKSTHVSKPKHTTACSAALWNISDTLGSAPSRCNSVPNLPQENLARIMFCLTVGQSSSI